MSETECRMVHGRVTWFVSRGGRLVVHAILLRVAA